MPITTGKQRALLHAALGDETRLAIAEELRRSDRSPKELSAAFDVPTNLLAHHLDVLEEAGAITRPVSAGDARRKYVRLTAAADELLGAPSFPLPPRVMFLCTRNSARSQLAAALWNQRTGCAARSAGTHPADTVHPGARAAARRVGLSLEGVAPRRLGRIAPNVQVITVCDLVHEELEPTASWWHWSIPAPSASGRAASFDSVVNELNERISRLGVPDGIVGRNKRNRKDAAS